jgi:hypothetical protein
MRELKLMLDNLPGRICACVEADKNGELLFGIIVVQDAPQFLFYYLLLILHRDNNGYAWQLLIMLIRKKILHLIACFLIEKNGIIKISIE